MTKDSEEYRQFKERYEADQKYRTDHPELFPWFVYFQFGWHHMTYRSDKEVQEMLKFYKNLRPDGKGGYSRIGRQPIFITRRKEVQESDKI